MRTAARLALAFVILFGAFLILPRSASQLVVDDAHAQIVPTPTLPGIFNSPKPSPVPDDGGPGDPGGEDPGEDPGSGGGDGPGSGGGDGPGSGGSGDGNGDNNGNGNGSGPNGSGGDGPGGKGGRNGNNDDDVAPVFDGTYQPSGSFSTNKLVSVASRLRGLGRSQEEVISKVYPPFIIAGEAAWTNTWGAPRYGPGPIVRTHEGQDVFCSYGDPILAPEAGTMSYSDSGLGGITARVHTSDTSYWYLTHLSATNAKVFPAGASVDVGDVVGFCGNSGHAITTPPHVHFGWYVNGEAQNPHAQLVKWLHEAEKRVLGYVTQAENEKVENIDRLTTERNFGDWFAPDLTELKVSGESLWASGSSPATGAFALAEAALQAALSEAPLEPVDLATEQIDISEGASSDATPESSSALAELLSDGHSEPDQGD